MARDNVAITDTVLDATVVTPAGTAINPTNGANIAAPGPMRKVIVRITNTNGTDRIVTFRAGAYPTALGASLGDLAVTVPATTGDVLVSLDGSRFQQADGSINIDFAASMSGFISCIRRSKYA